MNKLIIAFAVTVTILGGLTFGLASDYVKESPNALKSGALALGHLTLTAYDEHGNVIGYQQTDNTVINKGDDCIASRVFDISSITSSACSSTSVARFNTIHIGTATALFTENSLNLGAYNANTGPASVVITQAAASGGAATLLTANFVDVSATIAEASIQVSSTTSSDALAVQAFPGIPLGQNDDLTIQWTVTIDGN